MKSNSVTDVAKLRLEVEARFVEAVKFTSERSFTALQNYIALIPTIREVDNSTADVADYILNKSKAIFGTQPYQKNISWLSPEALYEQTNKINSAPDVVFFQTDTFWLTCCLYAEVRSLSLLLNHVFPTTIKRKTGNSIYKGFLIMEERLKTRLPRSPDKRAVYLAENRYKREALREAMFSSIDSLLDSVDQNHLQQFLEAAMAGDIRGIQKALLPLLFDTIVLVPEAESGKLGAIPMRKCELVFEVIRLLLPEQFLLTKEEFEKKHQLGKAGFYDGKYSRYQRDTFRTILGI